LPELTLSYAAYGRLNAQGDNAIVICHALTANSDFYSWWPKVWDEWLRPDTPYYFLCINMPGSCYGSTGPLSMDPSRGKPYFHQFPELSIRDMVTAYQRLISELGIRRIQLIAGGSMGGQQALEWAVMHPGQVERLAVLATSARHTPWGIAWNESQRLALEADPTFAEERPDAGQAGLRAARAVALLSYRHYGIYQQTQADATGWPDTPSAVTYQRYQGDKLVRRFNAHAYHLLSRAMDSHDLGRRRGGLEAALAHIEAPTLVVSLRTDQLFPIPDQSFLAQHIPKAQHHIIDSPYGHDGFLTEGEAIAPLMRDFLRASPAALEKAAGIDEALK
jgi:homoserine O-acetyltransferase